MQENPPFLHTSHCPALFEPLVEVAQQLLPLSRARPCGGVVLDGESLWQWDATDEEWQEYTGSVD